jgi:hypothetical protein
MSLNAGSRNSHEIRGFYFPLNSALRRSMKD